MDRLRVLHVLTSVDPRIGGPAASMLPLARALARQPGLEVSVFAISPDAPAGGRTVEDGGVRLTFFPALRLGPLTRRAISPGIARALWHGRGAFDIVHNHGIFAFEAAVSDALCRLAGPPYVMRPCGVLGAWCLSQGSALKRPFLVGMKPLLRGAAFVHCTSEAEAADVLRVQPAARTRVIPLGVRADDDDGQAGSSGVVDAAAGPFLLFLGRLHPIKGLDLLLPAFAEVRRSASQLRLVLAGPDEGMRAGLQAQARRLGVAQAVQFTGFVVGAAKRALLAGARALVLPSRHENFGVVVLEAAAAGTPAVVSIGVALGREVEAAGAGEVSEPSVPALVAAMTRVLQRPREDYAAGCARLAARFTLERTAQSLHAAYRDVLDGRVR
jgi:glycosyltransferase involved in cell wall biosynthesis